MKSLLFVFLLLSAFLTHAVGNYQAGEEKSQVCAACHGTKGISTNPQWPSLAGQHAAYLAKQLRDFKADGQRPSAVMTPIANPLTEQDIEDLAIFYSQQPLPQEATPRQYLARGEQLYRGGDFAKHITACIACHGPNGMGNAQAMFPVLSGQMPQYTVKELQAFKENIRRNDLHSIMRDISQRMDKEDMEAVAYYVAGLH
ncbi:c-type cytochrome [Legionella londiniensis]|uniref:Cytochrome c4 n=1 Tax=Legionella londiniensis TaxID=45068 RepID=A0A0W0VJZ8_9GAMM|nr:c-type cytochrome [Legionella londiniensis]KTD20166.1 cytochrome c4 [Legionella londiniensis]STX94333.1 cytochrome c4 [Legionella londiniensis]